MGGLVAFWLVCGFIGLLVGNGKGKGGAGLLLGLLLGPLGVVAVAAMSAGGSSTLSKIQARPAAAGWYDDPLGRFDGRYFDGSAWTQHVGRVEPDGSRRTLEDPV